MCLICKAMGVDYVTSDSSLYDRDTTDDDQNVDSLISGSRWNLDDEKSISYSFPDSASDYGYTTNGSNTFSGQFSERWQIQAEKALEEFSQITGITFVETETPNDQAILRFAEGTGLNTAFGYYPNSGESGGDMMFNASNYDADANIGTYTYATMMHELGHAMGLRHAHESGGPGAAPEAYDTHEYTVMTYTSFVGQSDDIGFYTIRDGHYAQSLMMLDIAALQRLYGADYTTEASDTQYTFDTTTGEMFINGVGQGAAQSDNGSNSNVAFRTIWDGDGVDTYDLSNFETNLAIDLTPGSYVDLDVGGNALRAQLNTGWYADGSGAARYSSAAQYDEYARGHIFNAMLHEGDERSSIENANGGLGDDVIIGNEIDNVLLGNAGSDTIMGGNGKDRIEGGDNRDEIWGGAQRDNLRGGKDRDKINGDNGRDYILGGRGKDQLDGGEDEDTIDGGLGDDTIWGRQGDDELTGGEGADMFIFTRRSDNDIITDYEIGVDLICINTAGDYTGYTIEDDGQDLIIDYGFGQTITLQGLSGQTLSAADFELA